MYIQITTRCNMLCEHCAFSCTAEGEDMSFEVFEAACQQSQDFDEGIHLGGGEPTIHPEFEKFLAVAVSYSDKERGVSIVTNGKLAKRALLLARFGEAGVIAAWLSQDEFHEPVSGEVVQAFRQLHRGWRAHRNSHNWQAAEAGIRTVTEDSYGNYREPILAGRELVRRGVTEVSPKDHQCVCEEWFVQPDGQIRQCGCPDSPIIGDVWSQRFDSNEPHCCWRYTEACHRQEEELARGQ